MDQWAGRRPDCGLGWGGHPARFRRLRGGDRGLIAAPGPLLASLCFRPENPARIAGRRPADPGRS
jgi:hypothetical protein